MISGDEIRSARERAHLTQQQLGALVGVTFRTVGNWERGETIPRNREAAIRSALVDYFDDAAPVTLRVAADAELLAEIARRFGRLTSDTPASPPTESTDSEAPLRGPHSHTRSGAKRSTRTRRGGGTAGSTTL